MDTNVLLDSISIIDRVEDIEKIVGNVKSDDKSSVHIIYALSGIGKSSLSIKLMQEPYFEHWNVVNTITNPINIDDNSSGILYFDAIWEGISTYFRTTDKYDLRFESYIAQGENIHINKLTANEIIDKGIQKNGLFEGLLAICRSFIKQVCGLGNYDADQIAIGNSLYEQNIKREYVRYILSKEKILLIVDNLQNIDVQSLRYLTGWIADSKDMGHCFLFEYTLSDKHTVEDVEKICEITARTGVKVYYSQLEKLDKSYIPELLERRLSKKPTHISFNKSALEHYINSNGNIRELLDFARRYKQHRCDHTISSTMANILERSSEAKYILSTLILMGGTLDFVSFENLWLEVIGEADFWPYVEELTQWDLVQLDQHGLQMSLAHASIRDEWRGNNDELNNIDLIIYHGLSNYFNARFQATKTSKEKDDTWQILLRLHAQIKPAKIAELMIAFKQNMIAKLSAEKTWQYLSKLIEHTKMHIQKLKNVYYDIIKICFESYLFQEGYYCIELMEKELPLLDNHYLLLQKLMYMSVLDQHEGAIELANNVINNFELNSRVRVNIALILLHCYISVNMPDKCLEIDHKLRSFPQFKYIPEYPFFLRLTNIYLSSKKSLKMAKKSISIFAEAGNKRQYAKSIITYSKLLATVGQYKRALKFIQKAEKILAQEQLGIAYVYHNTAAFMMLDSNYSEQVRLYIELAEDYVRTPYDKLSVIINQLAWCHATKDYSIIGLLDYRAAELLSEEPDKYIHAVVHYNFSVILRDAGNSEKADIHLQEAKKLMEYCFYVKLRLNKHTKIKDRAIKSRLRQPCHISFLSYWHYDLPDDLCPDMLPPQNID